MSNLVTDAEAKQMLQRCDKATPGEWKDDGMCYVFSSKNETVAEMRGWGASLPQASNGQFIAHARTDIPRLLSERERLLAIVRGLAESDTVFLNFDDLWQCAACQSFNESASNVEHKDACPYRLATQYMAEVTK